MYVFCLFAIVFGLGALICAYVNQTDDPFMSSLSVALGSSSLSIVTTVLIVDRLIKIQAEKEKEPAKYAAYLSVLSIYRRLRLLWGHMVADSISLHGYSGAVPQFNEMFEGDTLLQERAGDFVSELDLDSFVTISPTDTWDEYLRSERKEILILIDKSLTRHSLILTPAQIRLLHDLEVSPFMSAIDRDKEWIHVDMTNKKFGYAGRSHLHFFSTMEKLWKLLDQEAKSLILEDSDQLGPSSWEQDMSSLSTDIMARSMVGYTMKGQTYSPSQTYRATLKSCVESELKYGLIIFLIEAYDSTGQWIERLETHNGPIRLNYSSHECVPAVSARDINGFVRRAPVGFRPSGICLVPLAVSDIFLPTNEDYQSLLRGIWLDIGSGRVPGLCFSLVGREIVFK